MKLQASLSRVSRHVPSGHLHLFDRCPACGSFDDRKFVGIVQRNPDVSLLLCPVCKAVSTSHFPSEEFLEKYYSTIFSETYRKYNKDIDVTFSSPERFAGHITRFIPVESFDGKDVCIIDFGGGDGALGLAVAKKYSSTSKVQLVVVDFGESVVSTDSYSNISIQKISSLDDFSGKANVVLASASLEHVPNLTPILRKLFEVQASDGYFYLRTPFIYPMLRLGMPFDFSFPAHVHDLGVNFWCRFSRVLGFDYSIIRSAPSIVESSLRSSFLRSLCVYLLKFPARIEFFLFPKKEFLIWPFVGGWEMVFRKNAGRG